MASHTSSLSDAGGARRSWVAGFLLSSIGAKYVMAITGVVLVGFVLQHMVGNWQIFTGTPEKINAYAAFLKSLGGLLWVARLGLLAAVVLHIWSGLRLARLNAAARPEGYRLSRTMHTNVFARSMTWSGLTLLAFIVYHLLHFTIGVTNPAHFALRDALGRPDVYSMTVLGFMNPIVSGAYIVSMGLLAMHISHGATSMFQSLGWNHPKYNPLIAKIGPALALLLFVGNSIMPITVLMGRLPLPPGVTP